MRIFYCDYFTWSVSDDFKVFWESENPQCLQLLNDHEISGTLTLRTGDSANRSLVEVQIERFVAEHAGYLAPIDLDFPDEFSYVIENRLKRFTQHQFIRFGQGYALVLSIHGEFDDSDVRTYRNLFAAIKVDEHKIPEVDSTAIVLPVAKQTNADQVGSLYFL